MKTSTIALCLLVLSFLIGKDFDDQYPTPVSKSSQEKIVAHAKYLVSPQLIFTKSFQAERTTEFKNALGLISSQTATYDSLVDIILNLILYPLVLLIHITLLLKGISYLRKIKPILQP